MSVGEVFYLIFGIILLASLVVPFILVNYAKQKATTSKGTAIMAINESKKILNLPNGELSKVQLFEMQKMIDTAVNNNQTLYIGKATEVTLLYLNMPLEEKLR